VAAHHEFLLTEVSDAGGTPFLRSEPAGRGNLIHRKYLAPESGPLRVPGSRPADRKLTLIRTENVLDNHSILLVRTKAPDNGFAGAPPHGPTTFHP
jgi:hypothetical protein